MTAFQRQQMCHGHLFNVRTPGGTSGAVLLNGLVVELGEARGRLQIAANSIFCRFLELQGEHVLDATVPMA